MIRSQVRFKNEISTTTIIVEEFILAKFHCTNYIFTVLNFNLRFPV